MAQSSPSPPLSFGGTRLDLLGFGWLRLEDELRAAPKIQTRADGAGDDEGDRGAYDGENGKRSPNQMT